MSGFRSSRSIFEIGRECRVALADDGPTQRGLRRGEDFAEEFRSGMVESGNPTSHVAGLGRLPLCRYREVSDDVDAFAGSDVLDTDLRPPNRHHIADGGTVEPRHGS